MIRAWGGNAIVSLEWARRDYRWLAHVHSTTFYRDGISTMTAARMDSINARYNKILHPIF
jgi:hypothetical protein